MKIARFSLRIGLIAILSGVSLLSPLLPGSVEPAAADASTFMLNKTLFGANETIRIDLGILNSGCDSWYAVSDIYVVPRGSAVPGADLSGLDPSGTPNTVTASSGGGIVSEIIGFTTPSGTIGPGLWDVVEDVCQDGTFDGADSVKSPGFRVEIVNDVPPLPNDAIAQIKSDASAGKDQWEETHELYSDLFAALDAQDLYGALTDPTDAFLWGLQQSMIRQTGIDPQDVALKRILDVQMYYAGIEADPPDPDFSRLSPLAARQGIDPASNDPLIQSAAGLGTAMGTQSALLEALLASLERYQGADEAGDGEWALVHGRAVQSYAQALQANLAESSAALQQVQAAVAADDRPLDDVAADLALFLDRVASSGFTAEELRQGTNLGLTAEEMADVRAAILQLDPAAFSESGFLALLDQVRDANAAAATSFGELSAAMDDVVGQLEDDPTVIDWRPVVDAGGPYSGTTGSAILLDGIGSANLVEPVQYAWDLDGDGEFDDAAGVTATVTCTTPYSGLIGLQVTNLPSRSNVGYAALNVTTGNRRPAIEAYAPADLSPALRITATATFTGSAADPDGDPILMTWLVNGTPAAAGPTYLYSPTVADVGLQRIQLVVSDVVTAPAAPLDARQSWTVAVYDLDSDGDLWNDNADCDPANPNVNPGMEEVIGNGIDDDCDPTTSDNPPVPAFSWAPLSPLLGEEVQFTDASTDADGSIVAWRWDFGDGVTSTLQHPTHTYWVAASYTVTLQVTDDDGGIEALAQALRVRVGPTAAFRTSRAHNVTQLEDGAAIAAYSSVYGSAASYQPENAIDSSVSSYWRTGANQVTDQWITVDLVGDQDRVIDRVQLKGCAYNHCPRSIELRVAAGDAETAWTTVLSDTLPKDAESHEYSFAPVSADRVTLYLHSNWGDAAQMRLYQFQVHSRGREGGVVSMVEGPPASIVAVSSFSSSYPPERMIDTDTASYWRSASGQVVDQWVKVRLGGIVTPTIGGVQLRSSSTTEGVRDFEVQVSATTADEAAFTTVYSGTASALTTLQEFSFPAVTARYLKLLLKNNHGSTSYIRLNDLLAVTPDGANVARLSGVGATVLGYSGYYSDNYRPDYALDYGTATAWRTASGGTTDQWLTVRLADGRPYLIDEIELQAGAGTDAPRDFLLRVSDSTLASGDFTTVLTATLPQDGARHWFSFPPVAAKYVQLTILNNHGSVSYVTLLDWKVYSIQLGEETVPFDDLSLDPDGRAVAWDWDFGDGTRSDEEHPRHSFPHPGLFTVTLTVTDDDGLADSWAWPYTVLHRPAASLASDPAIPAEGQNTNLMDTSTDADGVAVAWLWQFSHRSDMTSQNPVVTFPDNGDYLVSLTATDSQLLTSRFTRTITVTNLPPTVDAGSNQALLWGEFATLNTSVSDPGSTDRGTLRCDWDFGNGATAVVSNCTSTTSRVPLAYAGPGVYTATLTVTDKDGASASDTLRTTASKRETAVINFGALAVTGGLAEVRAGLFDRFEWGRSIVSHTIAFTTATQSAAGTTDSRGVALGVLAAAPGETITVTARFDGDALYLPSTDTDALLVAPRPPRGDVVFIIDESGSMGPYIDDVKDRVEMIASQLGAALDFQLGLIGFGSSRSHMNLDYAGQPHVHVPMTSSIEAFAQGLSEMVDDGATELGFQAITLAMSDTIGLRSGAGVCAIMVTNEDADINEYAPATQEDALAALHGRDAIYLGIVELNSGNTRSQYGPDAGSLSAETGGQVFAIQDFQDDPGPILISAVEKCALTIMERVPPDLVLSKSGPAGPVVPGNPLTYTITVSNVSVQGATGVVITDYLPSNVTLLGASDGASQIGGAVTWQAVDLASGGRISRTVTVAAHDPWISGLAVITNTAQAGDDGANGDEPTPEDNWMRLAIPIQVPNVPPDLTPIDDQVLEEGETREVPLSATDPNGDPLALTGAALPAFAAVIDHGDGSGMLRLQPGYEDAGVYPGLQVSASDGEFTDTVALTVTVLNANRPPVADASGPYSAGEGSPLLLDASASYDPDGGIAWYRWDLDYDGVYTDWVSSQPTATVTWFDDYQGLVGLQVEDEEGMGAHGVATATAAVAVYNLPPQVEAGPDQEGLLTTVFSFAGQFTDPGVRDTHTWIWDYGDGITATIGLTPSHQWAQPGLYTVTLTVTDDDGGAGLDRLQVRVLGLPDLSLAKSARPAQVGSGAVVTFTLTYTNQGATQAADVLLTDSLPAGLSAAGPTAWSLGTVQPGGGGSVVFTATVQVTTTAYAILTNTARIQTATPESDSSNNQADAAVELVQKADLTLAKACEPAVVELGDTVTCTLTYTNRGPADAAGVVLADILPDGLASGGVRTWSLGTVLAGGGGTVKLAAVVTAGGHSLLNTAVISTTTPESDATNNRAEAAVVPLWSADLALAKQASDPAPKEGAVLVYTVTLTNYGPAAATGVVISDVLPAGLTYLADGGGAFDPASGLWALGRLAVGHSAALSISVTVDEDAGDQVITNTAVIWQVDQDDPIPGNEQAEAAVTVKQAGSWVYLPLITRQSTTRREAQPDDAITPATFRRANSPRPRPVAWARARSFVPNTNQYQQTWHSLEKQRL